MGPGFLHVGRGRARQGLFLEIAKNSDSGPYSCVAYWWYRDFG